VQISGFPVALPATSQGLRPDVAERSQKDVPSQDLRDRDEQRQGRSLDDLRVRDEAIQQQRIEASDRTSRLNADRQQSAEQFPLNIQRALQAFANNSPTPEQQLGIELVGVDTFA
jgi:hypothetical protein